MVLFHSQASCNKRVKADAIVLPFWKVKDKPKCAASIAKEYESLYRVALDSFSGEKGEIEFIYNSGQGKEKRLLILGLGKNEELTSQDVLEAYAKVTRALRKAKCTTVNVVLPTISELRIPVEDFLTNLTSGILSLNYNYPKYTKETKRQILC